MVENKVNWNTVLVVLVIGVVGILLLNNGNLFSGKVTGVTSKIGNIDTNDKKVILSMLSSCTRFKGSANMFGTCNNLCIASKKVCLLGQEAIQSTDDMKLIDCNEDYTNYGATLNCICCSP